MHQELKHLAIKPSENRLKINQDYPPGGGLQYETDGDARRKF